MGLLDTIIAGLRSGGSLLANEEEHPVAIPDDDYKVFAAEVKLSRTLLGGTRAMRAAGTTFLPQYSGEKNGDYINRLFSTVLFNKYRHAHRSHRGMVFSEPVKRSQDLPESVAGWLDNIDMRRRSIDEWLPEVFFHGEADGVSPILIDQAPLYEGATRAAAVAIGQRPRLIRIDPLHIIGRKISVRNGEQVVTQLRLKEWVNVDDGRYGTASVEQIRVLEPGRTELWQKVEDDWVRVSTGPYDSEYVTVVPYYTQETTPLYGLPFLEDLADKCLEHWQSSSDQRNYLKYARIPFHHFAGFNNAKPEDEITKIGGGVAVFGPPESKVTVIEHQGAAIDAGDRDLRNIEIACDVLGLLPALSISPSGMMTATESMQKSAVAHSDIQSQAMKITGAANMAIRYMAEWANDPFDGDAIEVNRDFTVNLDKTDLPVILQLVKELPALSRAGGALVLQEAKRRDLISERTDIDELLSAGATEGPTAGATGNARAQAREVVAMIQAGADVEEALDAVYNAVAEEAAVQP